MTARRSLTRTLCTLLACLWVSVASAPPASARLAPIEIAACASAREAQEDASETQAERAEAPACAALESVRPAYAPSAPQPEPKHPARPLARRVYIQHCALLL